MESLSHTTGTITVSAISSSPKPAYKNPNDVDFQVKYPEDYKGPKYMPEGIVTISKESAEQFTKAGIGQVVEKIDEKETPAEKSVGNTQEPGKQKSSQTNKNK